MGRKEIVTSNNLHNSIIEKPFRFSFLKWFRESTRETIQQFFRRIKNICVMAFTCGRKLGGAYISVRSQNRICWISDSSVFSSRNIANENSQNFICLSVFLASFTFSIIIVKNFASFTLQNFCFLIFCLLEIKSINFKIFWSEYFKSGFNLL